MDLDSVADELYSLPREEFIAARTARAKEARTGGERELAKDIAALGKPTLVAWLANQLIRERRDQIGPLLELGAALREATAVLSGEELRRLSSQQHQLLYALVQEARSIAAAVGSRVTEDNARGLDETLRAALADPALADQLAAGRLTQGLQHVGFTVTTAAAQASPRLPKDDGKPAADDDRNAERRAEELKQARQAEAEARSAADAAEAARHEAESQLDAASKEVAELTDTVRRLREELAQANDDQSAAKQAESRARSARDSADRNARDAQRRLDAARETLARLELINPQADS